MSLALGGIESLSLRRLTRQLSLSMTASAAGPPIGQPLSAIERQTSPHFPLGALGISSRQPAGNHLGGVASGHTGSASSAFKPPSHAEHSYEFGRDGGQQPMYSMFPQSHALLFNMVRAALCAIIARHGH